MHLEKHLCFKGRREQKQEKERKEKGIRTGIVPGLQVCVCREGRRALCNKSIHCRLATFGCSLLTPSRGVVFPCPQALSSALFSFPHHLPLQIPPSISHPGVGFQHRVENKRERNPKPTCGSMRRDRTQLCLMPISVSSGLCHRLLWGPLDAGGCLSQAGPGGGWGMQGCAHTGILFPCMAGAAGSTVPP